jgi:DNA polymerase III alpha subunit
LVAQYTATFRHKADFNAHRLLRAIDKNTLLSKLAKSEESRQDTVFIDQKRLEQLYRDVPYMLENTRKLVDACRVPFDIGSEPEPKNLKTYTGSVRVMTWQLAASKLCHRWVGLSLPQCGREDRYPHPQGVGDYSGQRFCVVLLD